MVARYGVLSMDPELRFPRAGLAVCTMTVQGESGKYIRLVSFGGTAEEMAEEVSKGDEISVTGYFKDRTWEDRQGDSHVEKEFVVKEWRMRT